MKTKNFIELLNTLNDDPDTIKEKYKCDAFLEVDHNFCKKSVNDFLEYLVSSESCLYGTINMDSSKRFVDGTDIRTSTVKSFTLVDDSAIVKTRNTTYFGYFVG